MNSAPNAVGLGGNARSFPPSTQLPSSAPSAQLPGSAPRIAQGPRTFSAPWTDAHVASLRGQSGGGAPVRGPGPV